VACGGIEKRKKRQKVREKADVITGKWSQACQRTFQARNGCPEALAKNINEMSVVA